MATRSSSAQELSNIKSEATHSPTLPGIDIVIQIFKPRKKADLTAFDESVRGAPDLAGTPESAWANRRAPLLDADRVLMSPTHLWLRRIPPPLHPKQLCIRFPRLANQLAERWDDYRSIDRLLTELATDRRGQRAGFSARIVQELHMVRVMHEWRKYNRGAIPVRRIVNMCSTGRQRHTELNHVQRLNDQALQPASPEPAPPDLEL
jgi:hypothetical protein